MEDKSKLERLVSDTERSIGEKKAVVMHKIEKENEDLEAPDGEKPPGGGLPPTEALKRFFDRIPLFSVPGIGNAGGEPVFTLACRSFHLVDVPLNDTQSEASSVR